MTRKRFKKLLMSYGYSRNDAEWLAEHTKILDISYQTYWDVLARWKSIAARIETYWRGVNNGQRKEQDIR